MKKTPTSLVLSTEREYKEVMERIDFLMRKGERNLNEAESQELDVIAIAAENYEKRHYQLPMPQSLEEMIELKRFEKRIKQKELARILEVTESKLSQILNKKREPDIQFIKNVYMKLEIDAKFILDHV
ncbi:transcriptional regulator [Chitinophaga sp. CF418]|uniref:transcriptional regulator n=1 Tax=Chitinophaga sp. CF418 TaxID=1855287 RepID=UPI000921202C|nr:transcriptional regulator [Chitinophaga sp. CF418]SHN42272.1 HTH-type transcriptional regulator / antitoxin HigA [Chitinophaga sp. CF418]